MSNPLPILEVLVCELTSQVILIKAFDMSAYRCLEGEVYNTFLGSEVHSLTRNLMRQKPGGGLPKDGKGNSSSVLSNYCNRQGVP